MNILEAIKLVLLGFTFYMEFGIYYLIYYSIDDGPYFAGQFSFFKASVGMKYSTSEDNIVLGINVLPVLIAVALHQVIKKFKFDDMAKQIELISE